MRTPEAKAAIRTLDEKLSILRKGWMEAPAHKKASWMRQIDETLDARIKHMRVRIGDRVYLTIQRK